MHYNEALKCAQAGRMADIKGPDELRSGLEALNLYFASYGGAHIRAAIESFENEISRRAHQTGAAVLHQQQMEQGKTLHGETMGEMGKLKTSVDLLKDSVDRLGRPRWIDWAILIAGAIAAIGVVISLFLIH